MYVYDTYRSIYIYIYIYMCVTCIYKVDFYISLPTENCDIDHRHTT